MNGQIETSRKKPGARGIGKNSLNLINAMVEIVAAAQPITGRGVGYKLFVKKLIASIETNDMQRVYRLLKEAREQEIIPWDWIVDESRQLEKTASWNDPDEYARTMINAYRREYWNQQPRRVEVWSEKGTVRGVLRPVLDEYGIGFRVVHGFASATIVHDVAEDTMAANWSCFMSATGIQVVCVCPCRTYRTGLSDMREATLCCGVSRSRKISLPVYHPSQHPIKPKTSAIGGSPQTTARSVGN